VRRDPTGSERGCEGIPCTLLRITPDGHRGTAGGARWKEPGRAPKRGIPERSPIPSLEALAMRPLMRIRPSRRTLVPSPCNGFENREEETAGESEAPTGSPSADTASSPAPPPFRPPWTATRCPPTSRRACRRCAGPRRPKAADGSPRSRAEARADAGSDGGSRPPNDPWSLAGADNPYVPAGLRRPWTRRTGVESHVQVVSACAFRHGRAESGAETSGPAGRGIRRPPVHQAPSGSPPVSISSGSEG
jgi:hypothetical protein